MTTKIAKDWFRANPTSVVVFHHRWDKLTPWSRECLSMPRKATVIGRRVQFDGVHTGRSEMNLDNALAHVCDAGDLHIAYFGVATVSYRAVPSG